MIVIALCAGLLTFVAWTNRRISEQRLLAQLARDQALQARDQALQATYLAQLQSAQAELNAAKPGSANQATIGNLWAALTVNHSTFKHGQTKDLRIEFSLINDGDKVIDPKIAESRININGKELAGSGLILSGLANDAPLKVLAPGETRQYSLLLGDHFKETGTYRIYWKGDDFQSPEIVLRILHEKAR
jgi:hypothetical protein